MQYKKNIIFIFGVILLLIILFNKKKYELFTSNLNKYKITKVKSNIFDSDYPIFVNFYTGDNGYRKYCDKLIKSLNKFNLPYYIVEIHSKGHKWTRICQQKPYILLKVMNKYPNKNVVWVDADAIIEKEPRLFKNITKSFAVHYIGGNEFASGTLFFKNNKISRNIIDDWVKENNKNSNAWDQRTLGKIINSKYKKHEYKLPKEYCSIFDRKDYQNIDRVISQWQASRKLKYNNRIKQYNNNNYKYKTEIHFITFWNSNNNQEKKRVKKEINNFKNNNVRIIKEIQVKKNNINKVFKNVSSGGKHNNHDIDIYIIEVPSVYKYYKTFSSPQGEEVNHFMYKLKLAARGNYENFKIAHGSFNINEANDFFKEYFKLLGNFKNFEEVKYELNSSNIFWLYDRVTYKNFGKEKKKDIDLVVDSIPATCFLLRTTDISNKCYINIDKIKNYLFDLQDFDSHYYPKKWLQNIKGKQLYLKKNNIQIPNLENHFMLGLYHMYIHKNEKQNDERITTLKNMSSNLGYKKNLDINILFGFINKNNYKIKKPTDKGLGFFIKELTRGGRLTKSVYEYNKKIYYLYKKIQKYNKDINILLKLEKYNFTPKILYNDKNNLVLEIENVGERLDKISKNILNKVDFKKQINYIYTVLEKKKIIHNDLNAHNLTLKNNKLYLIDFEHCILNNSINLRPPPMVSAIYCPKLPKVKNENNFVEYLKKNKCLDYE